MEMLGFVPQTPLASSRETRPTQWLPNLHNLRFLATEEANPLSRGNTPYGLQN